MTTSALALEDGSVFRGRAFGAAVDAEAEVVFNTCMTGYQEIATDASYRGQMVAMTYPLIGNYGVSADARESRHPWISALIVREYYDDPSNWRSEGSLAQYLSANGIPAICDVDTRALTRRLRSRGTMRGVLIHDATTTVDEDLVRRARSIVPISETDLVAEASVAEKSDWPLSVGDGKHRVVVVDCGVKENILRSLGRFHPSITVVPFDASASDILALSPSGIVVSNGPGDPIRLAASVTTMKDLIGCNVPILGICLGHQILGLAIGATTSRLPFGHHGGNHPVLDVQSGRVHITSQNHEFQVDTASVTGQQGFFVSQVNLNDRSVEGLSHESLPIFSVQYHPEGAPGPQDNQYLFDRFISLCENKT